MIDEHSLPWTVVKSKKGHTHIKDRNNRWVAKLHGRSAKSYDQEDIATAIIDAVNLQNEMAQPLFQRIKRKMRSVVHG